MGTKLTDQDLILKTEDKGRASKAEMRSVNINLPGKIRGEEMGCGGSLPLSLSVVLTACPGHQEVCCLTCQGVKISV